MVQLLMHILGSLIQRPSPWFHNGIHNQRISVFYLNLNKFSKGTFFMSVWLSFFFFFFFDALKKDVHRDRKDESVAFFFII